MLQYLAWKICVLFFDESLVSLPFNSVWNKSPTPVLKLKIYFENCLFVVFVFQVAEFGGTLGLFLGVSFITAYDQILLMYKYLRARCNLYKIDAIN